MAPAGELGFSNFLSQTDTVGKLVLFLLLAMSIASWYLIVAKAIQLLGARRRGARFLGMFWDAPSLQSVASHLEQHAQDEPFSHLTSQAIAANRHYRGHDAGQSRLNDAGSIGEFLTRAMRRVIDDETSRLESGLTVLASVGSTAPFVGLFGTVWGVYHALVAIGMSGQGTLDKVAGPVGEALIMTALGLAVAVPAVLAYNTMVRANRVTLSKLDSFAHDLFALLTTGTRVGSGAAEVTTQTGARFANGEAG